MQISTDIPGRLPAALTASGRLEEPVLAAGFLAQGRAPSMASMLTGWVLVELVRSRKTKTVPRQFVVAVTADEVVVFKASGGKGDTSSPYRVRPKADVFARWPRSAVAVEDLGEDGEEAKDITLVIEGERIAVTRPQLSGDPNTNHLVAVLSGAIEPTEPPADGEDPERRRIDLLDVAGLVIGR
jgi:hypothetical protein